MGTWTVSRSLIGFSSVSDRFLVGSSCEHRQSATGTANPAALCVWPQGAVTTRQGSQKYVRKTSEIRQKYVLHCKWIVVHTWNNYDWYNLYNMYQRHIHTISYNRGPRSWHWIISMVVMADGYRLSDKALLFVDLSPIVVGSTVTVRFYIALRIKTLPK